MEVREQERFNPFDLISRDPQPVHDRLFFDAFHAMNGGQAIAFRQQGQTFQDGILGMMPTIEDGPDRFNKGFATCATLIALGSGLGTPKPTDIAVIHLAVGSTARIPAEGAGMHQLCMVHHLPPQIDALVMIHQHEEGRLPNR
jgi:hypothetical protein